MNPDTVVDLGREAMQVMLLVSGPPLLVALVVGLLVSLFQAATQLNEMTLTFLPKLIAIVVILVLAGPWMIGLLVDYFRELLGNMPNLIG